MHLALDLFMIFAVWRWADWRKWQRYHATMIFLGAISILYNFMASAHQYYLWKIDPYFFSYTIEAIMHAFVFFPLTAFLFLATRPESLIKQWIHVFKWVSIFIIVEWIFSIIGYIYYQHGWNIWHSLIFDLIMFIGLIVHYEKPLIGYTLFIIVTTMGVWLYKIPLY